MTTQHLQVAQAAHQQQRDEHTVAAAGLLPQSPEHTLRAAHTLISRDDGPSTCYLFAPSAAAEFAQAQAAANCPAAVRQVANKISDFTEYPNVQPGSVPTWERGSRTVVDGCSVRWGSTVLGAEPPAGPPVGRLTVEQVQSGGYQITGYEPCAPSPSPAATAPGTAPGTATGSVPAAPPVVAEPVTPGRTRQLPLYGPAYAQVLTRGIANADTGVCQLMTPQAAGQFGAAHGGSACEEAVMALNGQVSNATWYAIPRGAVPRQEAGKTVLDACHLRFGVGGSTSTSASPAGPQLGNLELTQTNEGLVVTGYRPC